MLTRHFSDIIGHLQTHFPSMYHLYRSFHIRKGLPTPFEVKIAAGSSDLSEEQVNEHLKSLKLESTSTIQSAFDKQTMVSPKSAHM